MLDWKLFHLQFEIVTDFKNTAIKKKWIQKITNKDIE